MSQWIKRSKDALNEIIDSVKSANPELKIRVAFVGYRDVQDHPRFSIKEFTENIKEVKAYIETV
jgi:aryl-phospho-beta-D-glucosidase BglC (GH1 family)